MTPLRFPTPHGLANDFLIAPHTANPGVEPSSVVAQDLFARHRGVGADGLIYGLPPATAGADLRMVLFNADGSEAEISGNGIRCLAQAALRSAGRRDGSITIDTPGGRRVLTSEPTDDPSVDRLRVEMGDVTDGPELPPAAAGFPALHRGTAAVGNPHLVLHVESLDGIDPGVAGPTIEAEVPGGINVHFVTTDGAGGLRVLHWERGAGVTEACGSGATVSAALAHRWGLVGERVPVAMPGGRAVVEVGSPMVLEGPAAHIATIEVIR